MRGVRRGRSPWATHVLLLGPAALFGGVGAILPGLLGPASVLLGLALLLAWVAWTHGRRRARRGAAVPRGVEHLPASRLTSVLLLVALLTACGAEVLGVAAVVLEPSTVAGTGTGRFTLFIPLAIGAGLLVLTLVRAVTGRLSLELRLDDDGLRYRGWRTDRSVAWQRVREVATDRDRCELVVQPKGATEGPIRVPLVMFDVEVVSLVGAIEDRRSARRVRRSG